MTQLHRLATSASARLVHSLNLSAVATAALLLGGCASTPPEPSAALGAAAQAIATADRVGLRDGASPELMEARGKLAAAHSEVAKDHMVAADRLAREARVDAELALAKAEVGKAQAVNEEMRNGTATLSNEMQRKSGAQP
jgi:hypothetical protein